MDKHEKPHVRRFHDFELNQKLGKDSIIEAGRTVRVFEGGQGMFRLQQKLENARKEQQRILMLHPDRVTLPQLHYAMGVTQAIESVYTFLDDILYEALEAREKSE